MILSIRSGLMGIRLENKLPAVIVTGYPGCGTTVMMQMLEAGGYEVIHEPGYWADEKHPAGRYECRSPSLWLHQHGGLQAGQAIKIVWPHLRGMRLAFEFKTVLMRRPAREPQGIPFKLYPDRIELEYDHLLDRIDGLADYLKIDRERCASMRKCWNPPSHMPLVTSD